MPDKSSVQTKFDMDKFRLRRFVDKLIDLDEVEIHDEPVPLTALAEMMEGTEKAVLFRNAGPERLEIVAKTAGNQKRLAAAFDTTVDNIHDEYFKRLANPQSYVEVPSNEAPVHELVFTGEEVDLTRLPFYPHHAYDGSAYLSSAIDYVVDPVSGRRNVGCRRLSLRNRTESGTNVTAPSDLKRIYTACVARGERLPVTFTIGAHPLDFVGATSRTPGDELAMIATFRGETMPVVKSLTNNILVPADAEIVIEGYLDERGYVEPEGPYGEYMGYYGAIHLDPVFHCTAITMRRDAIHHTLLHGSAFDLDQTDASNIIALRTEADAMRLIRSMGRDVVTAYQKSSAGGSNTLRVAIRQRAAGDARAVIAALLGGITRLKHVWVFDEDIDIRDETQTEWAMGTRFQADRDMMVLQGLLGMTMDPSLEGRTTGAKAGFDCTRPLGSEGRITSIRSAAKVFKGPARFQTAEQALESGPKYYCDIVELLGSRDGREVACALDSLRAKGRLGRDRDGRYYLAEAKPGITAIIGELYHDPNAGA